MSKIPTSSSRVWKRFGRRMSVSPPCCRPGVATTAVPGTGMHTIAPAQNIDAGRHRQQASEGRGGLHIGKRMGGAARSRLGQ